MKHLMEDIAQLHRAFGHPVRRTPLLPHECINDIEGDPDVVTEMKGKLQARLMMRLRLIAEEFFELLEGALGSGGTNKSLLLGPKATVMSRLEAWEPKFHDYNLIETADALTDLMVVIVGMALEMGIPIDRTWKEVHRSNMAKVHPDGTVKKREDGKVLKPEGWTKPDIAGAIEGKYEPKKPFTSEQLKASAALDTPPPGSLERAAKAALHPEYDAFNDIHEDCKTCQLTLHVNGKEVAMAFLSKLDWTTEEDGTIRIVGHPAIDAVAVRRARGG